MNDFRCHIFAVKRILWCVSKAMLFILCFGCDKNTVQPTLQEQRLAIERLAQSDAIASPQHVYIIVGNGHKIEMTNDDATYLARVCGNVDNYQYNQFACIPEYSHRLVFVGLATKVEFELCFGCKSVRIAMNSKPVGVEEFYSERLCGLLEPIVTRVAADD